MAQGVAQKKRSYPIYWPCAPEAEYPSFRNYYRRQKGRPPDAQPFLLTHPLGNVGRVIKCAADMLGIPTLEGLEARGPLSINDRMKEVGAGVSPETMCSPLKVTVGFFIEKLRMFEKMRAEIGFPAYVLIISEQSAGFCRQKEYPMLQDRILQDMGFEFDIYAVHESKEGLFEFVWFLTGLLAKNRLKPMGFLERVLAIPKVRSVLNEAIKRLDLVEKFEEETRLIQSLIDDFSAAEKILKQVKGEAANSDISLPQFMRAVEGHRQELQELKNVPTARKEPKGKLLAAGEIFELEEDFGNIFRELAKRGFFLKKYAGIGLYTPRFELALARLLKFLLNKLNPLKHDRVRELAARGGLTRGAGGDSLTTVAAVQEAEEGETYDGVIIFEPLLCIPEIVARNIVCHVRNPPLVLTFDQQTGGAGRLTRVEAYLDMIERKKRKKQTAGAVPK